MKRGVWLLILLLIPSVIAECEHVQNGKTYSVSYDFCGLNYQTYDGIVINGNDLTIDCGTAVIRGDFEGPGITIIDSENVLVQNCHIANYEIGLLLINSTHVTVKNSGILRNTIGIKLIDSNQNYFERINDISLERMIRIVGSVDNYFDYTNKDLEGDFCRYNTCNKIFTSEPQSLKEILAKAIKNWLAI